MGDPALAELGARLVAIARALASGRDPSLDQLKGLLPAEVTDPLQETVTAVVATATRLQQLAQDQLAAARATATTAEQAAEAQVEQARQQLQQQLDQAKADAQRSVAAAEIALDQARATGGQDLTAATETRDAAVQRAEDTQAQAQAAYDRALARAQQVADGAEQAARQLVADAEQALQEAEAQVAAAAQRAQEAVESAAAAAAQLPGRALALGEDSLARLEGALEWPAGILSLLAKALIWLKHQCFPDVDELQVVWHEAEDGPAGLGLQWLDGDTGLLLVYRPPAPPAVGAGTLLIQTKGTDTVSFGSPGGLSVTFHGTADQTVVVGRDEPGPEVGPVDASLTLELGALAFSKQLGPLTVRLDKPTLTATVTHAESWTYDVALTLPAYGASLRLSDLLAQSGLELPVTIPSIDELRSLSLELSDGSLSVQEGAPA